MLRKITVFVLIAVFGVAGAFSLAWAGESKEDRRTKAVSKVVITDQMEEAALNGAAFTRNLDLRNRNVARGTLVSGDTVGFTVRDFSMNTNMGRKIAYDPATGNVHTIFTQWANAAADPYHEQYNFSDASITPAIFFGAANVNSDLDANQTRSGRVLVGPAGEAWISYHDHTANQTYLANDAGIGFYSFSSSIIAPGRFASADYKDAGATWFSTNDPDGDFDIDAFYTSTDGGATWAQTAQFLSTPAGFSISNVEIYPHFNPSTGNIEMLYSNENDAGGNVGDALVHAVSSDLGATWSFTTIYEERTLMANNTWYLVSNFSQQNSESGADGVTHVVFNGYGFQTNGVSPDSIFYPIMDVVYWNTTMSSIEDRVNLADSLHSRNAPVTTYMNTNAVGSGNNLGNAFPHISLHADGVLAVVWEQGELATDTSLVVATDPLTGQPNVAGIYANDLYCAVSGDNGATWSEPFYLAGSPAVCDRSPSVAKEIEKTVDGGYAIHYLYMSDPTPGQTLPNPENLPAAWVYGRTDITAMILSGINDRGNNVALKFSLEANYPNPFNPSTTIEYQLDEAATISLDVFNVVGQKVATLAQGRQAAGDYKVDFDASGLASGVYFYKLSVGQSSLTHKMMLMK